MQEKSDDTQRFRRSIRNMRSTYDSYDETTASPTAKEAMEGFREVVKTIYKHEIRAAIENHDLAPNTLYFKLLRNEPYQDHERWVIVDLYKQAYVEENFFGPFIDESVA